MKSLGGQVCQICGDNVGKTVDGEPFVACDVCAFPVCRPCYEYERKDGNQSCPQCKTRYKRHKGVLDDICSPISIIISSHEKLYSKVHFATVHGCLNCESGYEKFVIVDTTL